MLKMYNDKNLQISTQIYEIGQKYLSYMYIIINESGLKWLFDKTNTFNFISLFMGDVFIMEIVAHT